MSKINSTTIGIVIALVVIIGGVYFYSTDRQTQSNQEQQVQREQQVQQGQKEQKKVETIIEREIRSIAGKVTSLNISSNSFVMRDSNQERSFTVKLGEKTEFIRLVFPTDSSTGADFAPRREVITIKDLKKSEQVFVRSNSPIKTGLDIVSPLEVQVLP